MSTFFTAPRDNAGRLFFVSEDYPEDADDVPFDPLMVDDEPDEEPTMTTIYEPVFKVLTMEDLAAALDTTMDEIMALAADDRVSLWFDLSEQRMKYDKPDAYIAITSE